MFNRNRRNSDRSSHQRRPSTVSDTPTTFTGQTLSTAPSNDLAQFASYALPQAPEALAPCDPQHAGYLGSLGNYVMPTEPYQGYYQTTSQDPYQGYQTPLGPEPDQTYPADPTQFSQSYYATPSPEDMASSTLVAAPSSPPHQFHHSIAAAGSSTKKEKKKHGHTRQPSLPSVMSWKGGVELDYGHPPGVPHGYDPNSHQPGADYCYPLAISDADVVADVSDQHNYQDQYYNQGQGR